MLGGCRRANAVKAIPASVARRRQKSQAIKNPKEIIFAWVFSVLVVPRDGIEPPTRGFSIRQCHHFTRYQ
jgi:hypothetical protein